jgi:hypothetical protein
MDGRTTTEINPFDTKINGKKAFKPLESKP